MPAATWAPSKDSLTPLALALVEEHRTGGRTAQWLPTCVEPKRTGLHLKPNRFPLVVIFFSFSVFVFCFMFYCSAEAKAQGLQCAGRQELNTD